jgi:hypothetical protein
VPSAPDTQWRERTILARQRSAIALVVIAVLLLTHSEAWLGASAALLVAAAGLEARSPRMLTAATLFACLSAALIVVV